jgi:hypothetical protein
VHTTVNLAKMLINKIAKLSLNLTDFNKGERALRYDDIHIIEASQRRSVEAASCNPLILKPNPSLVMSYDLDNKSIWLQWR